MQQVFTKILFFALFLTLLVSCNTLKYVPDNENLLKKNSIYVNDKKKLEYELSKYLVQRPNLSTLGAPLSLHFYNFGNPDFDKTFEEWMVSHPKKYNSYEKTFSKKQTLAIYNTNRVINNWFIKKGQAPVIYNELKTKKSVNSLKDYYISKGFFEAEVIFDSYKIKEKELGVDYKITTNHQYYIDTITTEIESPVLDSIYQLKKDQSIIKKGNPFVFNDFDNEENRLVSLFRNSGIYHFKKNSMGFWTDSIKKAYSKNILFKIPNRIISTNDSVYKIPYKVQKVKEINIYTDFSAKNRGEKAKDSVKYEGYNFYSHGKLKYKPKFLVNSLFITPNGYYKDSERNTTRSHLRKLGTFSPSIDMDYVENEDESLTANIFLMPLKKFGLSFDLDAITSNIKPFGFLGKASLLGRNIFRGSETLELAFQGSINTSKDGSNSSQPFDAWEFITSASLKFPRIVFPLKTSSLIPKYMAPTTNIDISASIQKNIGLDRRVITAAMAYSWKSSKKVAHRFNFLNLQYIKNQNIDNYFKIYNSEYKKLNGVFQDVLGRELPENKPENYTEISEEIKDFLNQDYQNTHPESYNIVSDVDERRNILKEDVMLPIISYSFVYNSRENIKDNNFSHFTARLVSSGGLTSSIVKNKNEDGQKVLFGVPIAQYIKTEFEYKKYWELRKDNVLAFRTFVGAAIPYGNSSAIPFSRSYSAGGSNEIRAWRTFDLGPGAEQNTLEYNVSTFKLITNLEYRTKIANNIYGALFVDAGNIWDITDSNLVSEAAKLKSFNSFKNTAIGSGFGIRYDFEFFVFRFDIGFKTYEPYLLSNNKWFVNYNFGSAVYNIGINYPF